MNKKFIAFFLVAGMLSNIGIAYGATIPDEVIEYQIVEDIKEEDQGVPEGSGEVLGDMEDIQVVEDKEVVPGGFQGTKEDLEAGEKIEEQQAQEEHKNLDQASKNKSEAEGIYEDEDSADDKNSIAADMEPIKVTTGSGIFGGSTFEIDTYNSFDFPGSFEINPYAGRLKGTPVEIINTAETDLIITAEICKRVDESSPEVVRPDTFSNWASLGVKETASYIAFGFLVKDQVGNELATFWFDDEDSQEMEEVYVVASGEKVTIEIIGKHGMSWPTACTLSYDCKVGFKVISLEIQPELPEVVAPVEPIIPEIPEQPVENLTPVVIEDNQGEQDNSIEDSKDDEQSDQEDKNAIANVESGITEDIDIQSTDTETVEQPEISNEQNEQTQEDTASTVDVKTESDKLDGEQDESDGTAVKQDENIGIE